MSSESQLYFKQLPVGDMANYAYLIGCRETRKAVVVDPAWSVDALLDLAEADNREDHVGVGSRVGHEHLERNDELGGVECC